MARAQDPGEAERIRDVLGAAAEPAGDPDEYFAELLRRVEPVRAHPPPDCVVRLTDPAPFGARNAVLLEAATSWRCMPLAALLAATHDPLAAIRIAALGQLAHSGEPAVDERLLAALAVEDFEEAHAAAGLAIHRVGQGVSSAPESLLAGLRRLFAAPVDPVDLRHALDVILARKHLLVAIRALPIELLPWLQDVLAAPAPENPFLAFRTDDCRLEAARLIRQFGPDAGGATDALFGVLAGRRGRWDLQWTVLDTLLRVVPDARRQELAATVTDIVVRTLEARTEPDAPAGHAREFASRRTRLLATGFAALAALPPASADRLRQAILDGLADGGDGGVLACALARFGDDAGVRAAVRARLEELVERPLAHSELALPWLLGDREALPPVLAALGSLVATDDEQQRARLLRACDDALSDPAHEPLAAALLESAAEIDDQAFRHRMLHLLAKHAPELLVERPVEGILRLEILDAVVRQAPWLLVPELLSPDAIERRRIQGFMKSFAEPSPQLEAAFSEALLVSTPGALAGVVQCVQVVGASRSHVERLLEIANDPMGDGAVRRRAWTAAVAACAADPRPFLPLPRSTSDTLALFQQVAFRGSAAAAWVPVIRDWVAQSPRADSEDLAPMAAHFLTQLGPDGLAAMEKLSLAEEVLVDHVEQALRRTGDPVVERAAVQWLMARAAAMPEDLLEKLRGRERAPWYSLWLLQTEDPRFEALPFRELAGDDPQLARAAARFFARARGRADADAVLAWLERDPREPIRAAVR